MSSEFTRGLSTGRDPITTQAINCIVGTVHDDNDDDEVFRRISISLQTLPAGIFSLPVHDDETYARSALMSLEGLFRPYSVESNIEGIAHFVSPTGSEHPNVNDLNPFGSGAGDCDIDFVTSHRTVDNEQTIRTDDTEWFDPYTVRGIALKGPLIVNGWGYDINGHPVPNSGEGTDKFLPDHRKRSDKWKVGPVDLRWNENRGVWEGGSTLKLGVVLALSGAMDGNPFTGWLTPDISGITRPLHRPRYAIRFVETINSSGDLTYDSMEQRPFESGADILTFNIMEGRGDIHTLGVGTPVIVYRFFGVEFVSDFAGSFAYRTNFPL